ncbi:g4657 [Coccomyxa viridis]|uniref:G4657 protein n=1 Tax=Coccomyxa viridis TaxID=1274662 RepID=A0ABP1FVU4_9CHLO
MAEASMARITCHCEGGDIQGVCLSATVGVPLTSKVRQRPNPAAQCSQLCATKEEVLRRCENAAAMHVGDATCTGFSFEECALSCADGCDAGCEVGRREHQCKGLRIGN